MGSHVHSRGRRRPGPRQAGLAAALALALGPGGEQRARPGPGEAPDPDAQPAAFVATDDLAGMEARRLLRVLVLSREEPLRDGERALPEGRKLLADFAARRGWRVQYLEHDAEAELLPALREGAGDVIADVTPTAARRRAVAFTRPYDHDTEYLVGRRGAKAPKSPRSRKVWDVHVRAGSPYEEGLKRAKARALRTVPVEAEDEEIAADVERGRRPLTVLDGRRLAALEPWLPELRRIFPVASRRPVAFAVRAESPLLRAAIDAFLVETALARSREARSTGDLGAVVRRGALRVLTRNNAVTYFLHRGQRFGFDYELARRAAKELGVRVEMVVVPSRDLLVPWLLEGRGDVIAASFTVTPERAAKVAFTRPYLYADEVVVQRTAGPTAASLEDLRGRRVWVRPSTSQHRTLQALAATWGIEVGAARETDESETLIDRVARGEIDFTAVDSHILQAELAWRDDVEAGPVLPQPGGPASVEGSTAIAFAVRPHNPRLRAFLDDFVRRQVNGTEYNLARRRYFADPRIVREKRILRRLADGLSPWDDLFRRYSLQYGFDWRLMAAQSYVESRFDPEARSWAGALGLFQLMPATAHSMGFTRLHDPEESIHAGIRYMNKLARNIDPGLPLEPRLLFALAAYNAGLGHLLDARRLAAELGRDPNQWFGHVEQAMLLLQQPEYYARTKNGYCRGSEPVHYVAEVRSNYDQYVRLVPP